MTTTHQPGPETNTADHAHVLTRQILLQIGRQRSLLDARACSALFGFVEKARAIRRRLLATVFEHGLSEAKFCTLTVLYGLDPDPSSPSDLAFHAGVTRATMTDILNQMVESDWISRQRSGDDRRSLVVRLRREGFEVTERAIHAFMSTAADVLADPEINAEIALANAEMTAS